MTIPKRAFTMLRRLRKPLSILVGLMVAGGVSFGVARRPALLREAHAAVVSALVRKTLVTRNAKAPVPPAPVQEDALAPGSAPQEATSAPPPALTAEVPPPRPRVPWSKDGYLGVVLARNAADIAPRFEGRLASVNVRVGDKVTAGTVLATLTVPTLEYDVRMAQAEVNTAELDVDRASTELSQAGERLSRRQKLDSVQLTTADDVSSADYQARLAKNHVSSARASARERRARLGRLQRDLHDTEIVAPFDGVIAARYVDPGATVRSLSPIVRLITLDDLLVRFAVAQAAVREISVGTRVTVRTKESQRVLSATVERVAAEVEPASHMVFVEARVESALPGNDVLSGELARVTFTP